MFSFLQRRFFVLVGSAEASVWWWICDIVSEPEVLYHEFDASTDT